jgi:molybdopterin-guanine dinucleotide biosynthesis protein A
MRIFGVILAGGQGQRMGGVDKALVPLAGAPLLAHVIARLEPQVERLVLSAIMATCMPWSRKYSATVMPV